MADPFVAEVRIFPFTFPPKGWAFCDGQLLPLSQNTALFALIGTFYGGDGKSNFALPDMQGNVPVHPGQGPGLSLYDIGQQGGTEAVTLLQSEMPLHNHNVGANLLVTDSSSPANNIFARAQGGTAYRAGSPTPPLVTMAPETVAPAGGSLPHNNMMPYLTLNFCIALQGVFPPRP